MVTKHIPTPVHIWNKEVLYPINSGKDTPIVTYQVRGQLVNFQEQGIFPVATIECTTEFMPEIQKRINLHDELVRECKLALDMIRDEAMNSAAYAASMGYKNMHSRLTDLLKRAKENICD